MVIMSPLKYIVASVASEEVSFFDWLQEVIAIAMIPESRSGKIFIVITLFSGYYLCKNSILPVSPLQEIIKTLNVIKMIGQNRLFERQRNCTNNDPFNTQCDGFT